MLSYLNYLSREKVLPFVSAYILALITSMTIHEYMHARVAYSFGDDTAKLSGRLTLNPLAHISPLGLLSFLVIGYGWANPVPVNILKFKNKRFRLGMLLVSVAGVLANIVMAFVITGLYVLAFAKTNIAYGIVENNMLALFIYYFFVVSMSMNISLFFFNLLPIPPLDGFNFLNSVIPGDCKFLKTCRQYGFSILIGFLIIMEIFDFNILGTLVSFVEQAFLKFWSLIFA